MLVMYMSANKPPFAKQFTFSDIQFTAIIWWGFNYVGVWSGLNVLVSKVMPDTAIDYSKLSLWKSWLSISSTYLQVESSFILIFF